MHAMMNGDGKRMNGSTRSKLLLIREKKNTEYSFYRVNIHQGNIHHEEN